MAEGILNSKGQPRFKAYSAGSHPSGAVRPEAIRQLELAGMPMSGLRSKSWDEFAKPDAPKMDFVITVCDNTAREACPLFLNPSNMRKDRKFETITGHWGVHDPAAVHGSAEEIERSFGEAFKILERRISRFLSLPFESTDAAALKTEIERIGQDPAPDSPISTSDRAEQSAR